MALINPLLLLPLAHEAARVRVERTGIGQEGCGIGGVPDLSAFPPRWW